MAYNEQLADRIAAQLLDRGIDFEEKRCSAASALW